MESPPIPSGILHNHSHYHTHYSPLNHLLLTGLFSLRACTTRRLGATSGFSPLHPACLVSPLPLSSSATTFYRIYSPLPHPLRLPYYTFLASGSKGLASIRKSRAAVPRSTSSPPLADALHDQAHAHLPRSRSPRSRPRPLHRYKPACLPASAAPRFLVIEHLALYTTYPPPPIQRALLLYNEPLPHTTLLSTPRAYPAYALHLVVHMPTKKSKNPPTPCLLS